MFSYFDITHVIRRNETSMDYFQLFASYLFRQKLYHDIFLRKETYLPSYIKTVLGETLKKLENI